MWFYRKKQGLRNRWNYWFNEKQTSKQMKDIVWRVVYNYDQRSTSVRLAHVFVFKRSCCRFHILAIHLVKGLDDLICVLLLENSKTKDLWKSLKENTQWLKKKKLADQHKCFFPLFCYEFPMSINVLWAITQTHSSLQPSSRFLMCGF